MTQWPCPSLPVVCVQDMIADTSGMKSVEWDGYMKYWAPSKRFIQVCGGRTPGTDDPSDRVAGTDSHTRGLDPLPAAQARQAAFSATLRAQAADNERQAMRGRPVHPGRLPPDTRIRRRHTTN